MVARVSKVWLMAMALVSLSACVATTGCEEAPDPNAPPPTHVDVTIDGRVFTLELAADEQTRVRGLAMRETIEPDGGMLFSFRNSTLRRFVMRDCLTSIDIIFLDASGRVTRTHHMPVEPPRAEDGSEGEVGDSLNREYHARLPTYSSRYSAKYAIELAGGTLEQIEVGAGDRIELDFALLERVTE